MVQPVDPSAMFEASMNFDMDGVRPFLEQLNANLSLGLDVDKLVRLTEQTPLDTLHGSAFDVSYDGETVAVRYSAYMDDHDSPDLAFFVSSEALATAIDAEMEAYCEARGI